MPVSRVLWGLEPGAESPLSDGLSVKYFSSHIIVFESCCRHLAWAVDSDSAWHSSPCSRLVWGQWHQADRGRPFQAPLCGTPPGRNVDEGWVSFGSAYLCRVETGQSLNIQGGWLVSAKQGVKLPICQLWNDLSIMNNGMNYAGMFLVCGLMPSFGI